MLVAVILGNRMNADGTMSDTMVRRLLLALRLNAAVSPDAIILSGGKANALAGVAEADTMFDYLVEKGVPAGKLIREDKSHTTKENARYSAEIAKRIGATELLLVTTNEHMSRPYLNPIRLFQKELAGTGISLAAFSGN